jgi:hypothetical protein
MKLTDLIDTETDGISYLLETYTTSPLEKIEQVQKQVLDRIGTHIEEYINNLWVPTDPSKVNKPFLMNTLPASLRAIVVDMLDELYPEKELLLKFHQYCVLANTLISYIVEQYRIKYQKAVEALGHSPINFNNN